MQLLYELLAAALQAVDVVFLDDLLWVVPK
jgi:hypothetical protein